MTIKKETKIKVGTELTAVNPCEMRDEGYSALTVGKIYTVLFADHEDFIVEDDQRDEHYFDINPESEDDVFFAEVPYVA